MAASLLAGWDYSKFNSTAHSHAVDLDVANSRDNRQSLLILSLKSISPQFIYAIGVVEKDRKLAAGRSNSQAIDR